MDNVIDAVELAVLPPRSWIVTVGCVGNATAFAVRVPDSAPVPAGLGVPGVIDNVTALVSLVTVWPIESWIVTFGCVVKAEPPVAPAGEVVNASLLATPMTLSAALMAGV